MEKSKEIYQNDWELWIIGSGEEEQNLKNMTKGLGIEEYIKFIPFTNDITSYMKQSSIYAMSSRWEGFGLVVIEALEVGLPVVSFDLSGPKEILSGYECGIITKENSVEDYAQALLKLMNNYDLRKEYSKNAIHRAKDFYENNIIDKWKNILG